MDEGAYMETDITANIVLGDSIVIYRKILLGDSLALMPGYILCILSLFKSIGLEVQFSSSAFPV